MEPDYKEPKPELSLELDQEKPKKKSLWQKILDRIEELRREEEGRSGDPSDW